jgi:MFS family permease
MLRWMQCLLVLVGLVWGNGSARAQAPAEAAPGVEEAAVEAPVAVEDAPAEEAPSPWTLGLISSMLALGVGGFSAVLGIWVDRDKSRPAVFAGAMSALITTAILVGIVQSYLDAVDGIQARADLDRMLDMVEEIGAESGDPELAALATQNRRRRPAR